MVIKNSADLDNAIAHLEIKQQQQKEFLRTQIKEKAESLKPLNLIKHTVHNIAESPDLKTNLLKVGAGLGVAFLSKKVIGSATSSIFRKILVSAVEFGLINTVKNNANSIKEAGSNILSKLFSKKSKTATTTY